MANRTDKGAKVIKGTNPQYLIEKIIRMRIYDCRYWKEECFAVTAEYIVDKGMALKFVGGIYGGNVKPTPFLCLLLKMLQIQPDKDIVVEFIRQEDFKYVRALGAVYLRLTGSSLDVYKYLEPLYNDYRKLRFMDKMGTFELIYMDEFIDKLLRDERVCDIQLPRLQKRNVLVETSELPARKSALDADLENMSASSDEEDKNKRERQTLTKHDEEARERERERQKEIALRKAAKEDGEPGTSTSHKKDDKEKKRKRDKLKLKRNRETSEEREIREQNELRAKLGLAPLEKGVIPQNFA